MTDKSNIVSNDLEREPLSYALNRAKKLFKKEAKSKITDLIRGQKIRIFAEKMQISESDECYRFSINKSPFLEKTPRFKSRDVRKLKKKELAKLRGVAHSCFVEDDSVLEINDQSTALFKKYEESDRIAYENAYSKNSDLSENDKSYTRLRINEQIVIWNNIEGTQSRENCLVDMSTENFFEPQIEDYIATVKFGLDFNSIYFWRIQMLPNRHMKFSRYRCNDNLILVKAENLSCLKNEVEEFLSHSEEHRSERPPHRPKSIDETELFVFLDKHFEADPEEVNRRGRVSRAIRLYEDTNSEPDGGVSKSTVANYVKRYKAHCATKSKK